MGDDIALRLGAVFAVVPAFEILVACDFALDDDLTGDDDARVGLAVENPDTGCSDTTCNEKDPVDLKTS